MLRLSTFLFLMLSLASCASLSEEECLIGNWQEIGFEDGANGRAPEFIARHRKACAEVGIAPNLSLWLEGREKGLRAYCRPQNAYAIGRRGGRIAPYCTSVEAISMRPAYDHGRIYYEIGQDISELHREESRIESDLSGLDVDELGKTERHLRSSLLLSLSRISLDIQQLRLRRLRYDTWP